MKIYEYIGSESCYKKEIIQINRIIKIIIEWAKEINLEKCFFFKNVNYYHKGLGVKWNRQIWNGEIDLLFISKNHFIVFELKNKKGTIIGQTNKGPWKIKYHDSDMFIEENDYFMQCSKMKVFFSSNYYPQRILRKIDKEYKLRPDILLVFLNGSDTSQIFYSPPVKYTTEEWYSILNKISNEDKNFMEKNFHYEKIRDIININFNNERIDSNRLKSILDSCNYEYRVVKWFHVITEDRLKELLPNLGSDSYEFDKNIIDIMVKDFNLILDKEYCT